MKKLFLALSVLLIFSCKTTTPDPDVYIEWVDGRTFTYSYRSGLLVGGNWYVKFVVIDGSGDLTLKGYINNSKKLTETFAVEEGLTYTMKVSVGFGNCWGNNSATAEIRTASAENNQSLQVDCDALSISSISVSEVTD